MKTLARTITASAATAAFAFMALGFTTGVAQADDVRILDCSYDPGDKDNGDYGRVNTSGVNMRGGPSTSCPSRGQASPSHKLDFHCYYENSKHEFWTYAVDVNTGVRGWIRTDFLSGGGGSKLGC